MAKTVAKKSRPCIECGGAMSLKSKWETLEYKEQTTKIRTKGWWCDSCEEGILDAGTLKASEQAFLALKANVDGLLPPARVVVIRKRLGLSQRKAGELLGGGPRAFQKYESGKVMLSAPMSNLLRLLDKDPARLQELEHAE